MTALLQDLGTALPSGDVDVVDCTGILGPDTPLIKLPPPFRNTPKIEMHKISEYDDDGPVCAWNRMVLGEHSGTHFDAPIHWYTGRDNRQGSTDTLDVTRMVAPANVIDCPAETAAGSAGGMAPPVPGAQPVAPRRPVRAGLAGQSGQAAGQGRDPDRRAAEDRAWHRQPDPGVSSGCQRPGL